MPGPTRRELIAGASAALAAPAAAVTPEGRWAVSNSHPAAEAIGGEMHAANPQFALSLAVARSDGLAWAGAYGRSNLEFDVPATPDHTFRLGSISKVLTSTAAARLASRGVLDLDAPIATWLPDLPAQHRATTLRQLLTHQGGIRHYLPKDTDVTASGGQIYQRYYPTREEILALFIEDPLVAPPGTRVSYSSFGYTLASLVMEAAAGKDFRELIAEEIAGPFALPSLIDDDPMQIRPWRASGYVRSFDLGLLVPAVAPSIQLENEVGNMPYSSPAFCWAGAGFLMTPSDTARFGAAMIASPNSGISERERALLFTPLTEATTDSPPLGLGWRVDSDAKGRRRWHHAGSTPGGRSSLVVYPDLDLSIAMALNVMVVRLDVLGKSSELADAFA
jgi:serine beta-lactamase-like protein LACTB, mitochondrial